MITKLPVMKLPAIKKIVLDKNEIKDIAVLNESGIETV